MKKYLIAVFSVLALGAYAGCELDDNGGEGVTGDTTGGDTVNPTVLKWIKVMDVAEADCKTNPGSDIDAVKLTKGTNTFWATTAIGDPDQGACQCKPKSPDAGYDCDPNKAKNAADEDDQGQNEINNFVSLNGRSIFVQFADAGTALVLEKGDKVDVYEVVGTGAGSQNNYMVFACPDSTDAGCVSLGQGSGLTSFTIP